MKVVAHSKMKIAAYIPLHYGKEYLHWSIKSVQDVVDKIVILYTPRPSYGFGTAMHCPDTKEELYEICRTPKTVWCEGVWNDEGAHRGEVVRYASDAQVILPIDSDEVWDTAVLQDCIKTVADSSVRNHLVSGFVHFWRSFNYACQDVWAPVRALNMRAPGGQTTINGRVFHFGYAQCLKTVQYKIDIHGHKNEWRKDWFDHIYRGWPTRKTDLHPTTFNWWNAEPFDKTTLPSDLKAHPYYGLDVIE